MAKKFKFNLQPVLRYREIIEEQKKKDFAIANRASEEEKMRHNTMSSEREITQQDVIQLYAGKADFAEVVEAYRHINTLDLGMVRSRMKQAKLDEVTNSKRNDLVESGRNRRVLELLKEKRREAHVTQADHEEQTEIDELAIKVQRRGRR